MFSEKENIVLETVQPTTQRVETRGRKSKTRQMAMKLSTANTEEG